MSDQSAQPICLDEAGQEHPKLPEQHQPALSEKVQQFVGSLRLPGAIGALSGSVASELDQQVLGVPAISILHDTQT